VNGLNGNMKCHLARNAGGRVLLHLGCLCRGGRWAFHWEGIRRECRRLLLHMVPRRIGDAPAAAVKRLTV